MFLLNLTILFLNYVNGFPQRLIFTYIFVHLRIFPSILRFVIDIIFLEVDLVFLLYIKHTGYITLFV